MPSSRPLIFFGLSLALGALLASFPHSQAIVLLVLLALLAIPVLGLGLFILLNGLPRGQKRRVPDNGWPQGLGSPWMLAVLTIAAMLAFTFLPELDRDIARRFYAGGNRFIAQNASGNFGRQVGYLLPFLVLAAYVFAWLAARFGWPTPFTPKGRDVLFLSLAMLIGPGLIINLGMKDHLHRPRPAHLSEFGGGKEFRPFYRFDGACLKNCSFPSGEAAEAFWMLAPASLVPLPWRGVAMTGAAVFGALVSLLRMAFGGHFLSDVIFAALIMWGLLLGLRRLLYRS